MKREGLIVRYINCTLSLQVWRTEVNYWKVDEPKLFASDSFPVVMYADKEHELCYYSLPIEEYPGLFKVGVVLYKVRVEVQYIKHKSDD